MGKGNWWTFPDPKTSKQKRKERKKREKGRMGKVKGRQIVEVPSQNHLLNLPLWLFLGHIFPIFDLSFRQSKF